jgi:hemerythrin-like domain-containing protein
MSGNGSPYADTSSMYVVHTMFRREFALLPGLVRGVALKDTARAAVVADHIRLVNDALHRHHSEEDEYLWPRLLERVPKEIDPLVRLVEDQHEVLGDLIRDAGEGLDAWAVGADSIDGRLLAVVLQRLAVQVYEHMSLEEKLVLPLIERHVFASEWAAMEQDIAANISPDIAPVMMGMVIYEGGLEVLPPELREPLAEIGPKAYASHCELVHGTPTPPRSTEVGLGTPYVGIIAGRGE